MTADGVDLTPAQARRLAGYLLEAADVAERESAGRMSTTTKTGTHPTWCSDQHGFDDGSGD
ncbi:MAG: hypothetical protein M3Q87_02050 [Actinomycetota bacterium]|nr:hypothetical protein [Actinomycetota bacterium]